MRRLCSRWPRLGARYPDPQGMPEFKTSPTWPPPGRWWTGIFAASAISGCLAGAVLWAFGSSWVICAALAALIFGVFFGHQALTRKAAAKKERVVTAPEAEVTALREACRRGDKDSLKTVRRRLASSPGLTKKDADAIYSQVIWEENPALAKKWMVLD